MAVTYALVAVLLICEPEANSAVNQSRSCGSIMSY
jgi:hypothetical protein